MQLGDHICLPSISIHTVRSSISTYFYVQELITQLEIACKGLFCKLQGILLDIDARELAGHALTSCSYFPLELTWPVVIFLFEDWTQFDIAECNERPLSKQESIRKLQFSPCATELNAVTQWLR